MAKIDDSVKKKVPELRFKGFTDDWEERKLIEVADYRNGKAHEKYISEAGDYIVVNSKFVSTNGLVKKYSDEMIAPLSKNEIAFVLSDVPNGRAIARTFLISEENKYSLNQRIAGITPHADTNSYFLHSLMNRNHYFLRFDDGVSQTNLSKKEVEKWVELYPSYGEQQRIGSFFKQLDDTIALHQRKLDLLKEQKKGFLQKMFPKNGEKVPELRFAGFADDWEERKLNEVAIFYNGQRIPIDSSLRKQGEYPYYGATGIIDYVEDYIFDGEFVLLAEDGANITMRNSPIAYLTQGKFWLNNHAHIMAMKDGSNNFLVQLLEKQNYEKYNSGTAQPKLNSQVVKSLNFLFPTKEEQKKIGSFFKQLDNTIALYQRKLDLLKEQKKGFLQKMFV